MLKYFLIICTYLTKLYAAVTNIFKGKVKKGKVKKHVYSYIHKHKNTKIYTRKRKNIIVSIRSKMDNFANLLHFHSK